MQILDFSQTDVCYMMKDKEIKIDRSDIWGDSFENKESLLSYCQKFIETRNEKTAHVIYLHGQGGIGKTFACREVAAKLQESIFQDDVHVVVVDLYHQKGFEDSLKQMADEIAVLTGKKDLFPRFYMAYYNYKLKIGEKPEQEERSTKLETMQNSSPLRLLTGAAEMLSPFGTVSDVINLANEGYKWFLEIRNSRQYKASAYQIEAMDADELKHELTKYFAIDFCAFMQKNNKKKKKIAFFLDTVESMRYQILRSGKGEDYLEWLAGNNGLFRLLPDCFWLLFGREEIFWEKYDIDWKETFICKQFNLPTETAVREYLLCHLRLNGSPSHELVDEIIQMTDRYPLAIEHCIDIYFRIWNNNLRTNRVSDLKQTDAFRPHLDDLKELFLDDKGKKLISTRFLQYYTLQEREVLYTLVCLGTWTDEILATLIFKDSGSNLLIYEEMCATSFIKPGIAGQKSVRALMLDTVMAECPQRLKKNLYKRILRQIEDHKADDTFWLLYKSAVRIAKFCTFEHQEWQLLGPAFIKAAKSFTDQAAFKELFEECCKFPETAANKTIDDDTYNAVLICKYFACVFQKEDAGKELSLLQEKTNFGTCSLKAWEFMIQSADDIKAFRQAYEITALLDEKISDVNDQYYYQIHNNKCRLMYELRNQFDNGQIEKELEEFSIGIRKKWDKNTAEKMIAGLWFDYYYSRENIATEIAVQKMKDYTLQYQEACTDEQDVTLCLLKIMTKSKQRLLWDTEDARTAYQGLRMLDALYGKDIIEIPTAITFVRVIGFLYPEDEDIDLYRKIFALFYRKFYTTGDFEAYDWACYMVNDMTPVQDIIQQGILYLSNLSLHNSKSLFRLLLCYSLWDSIDWWEEDKKRSGHQLIRQKILNNQILLQLFQKATQSYCELQNDAAKERLFAFLNVMFIQKDISKISQEDTHCLAELFSMCRLGTDYMAWKTACNGTRFKILDHIHGWQFGFDPKADVWIVNAALYTAWHIGGTGSETAEAHITGLLDESFGYRDNQYVSDRHNEKAAFWLSLLQEAKRNGKEWEQHMHQLFQEVLPKLKREKRNLDDTNRTALAVYDARFFEQEEETEYILEKETICDKELCASAIHFSNYKKIYDCISPYLPESELTDIFVVLALEEWRPHHYRYLHNRPGKTELAFFESEYFLWLKETFSDAAEQKLEEQFPALYEAREEYQSCRNSYLNQLNKTICEIKESISTGLA